MGKGLRSSVNKTNNRKLKKNVFGPVETARTERLSQKLLELASQPKPPKSDMEVEESNGENSFSRETYLPKLTLPFADSKQAESEAKATNANDTAMDVDLTNAPRTSWIKAEKRAKEEKRNRIAKKQKRKVINQMTFKKNPRTGKK
ncbi:hypothetical protein KCU71_g14171, partial [Aureobasidium melanogenum]